MIPDYVNCKNRNIEFCSYVMHKDCPESCAYIKYIFGDKKIRDEKKKRDEECEDGIGAMVNVEIFKQIVEDKALDYKKEEEKK